MSAECPCGRPSKGDALCPDCSHALQVALGDISAHWCDLDTVKGRQTRYGGAGGGRGGERVMTGVRLESHPKPLTYKGFSAQVWDNRSEAARCANTKRPLAHLIDSSDRQDEMNDTRALPDDAAMRRFTPRLQAEGECLVFQGARTKLGYGRISFLGKPIKAHRFAWMAAVGEIPDGLHVLHHCDNPPCCNPAHLFLGTHQDNMADMDGKGYGGGAMWRAKTHCPQGHPYSEANTYRIPSRPNARYCRECRADWVRRRNAARRKSA